MARQNIYFLTAICLFRQGSRLRVVLYDTCFNKKKTYQTKIHRLSFNPLSTDKLVSLGSQMRKTSLKPKRAPKAEPDTLTFLKTENQC